MQSIETTLSTSFPYTLFCFINIFMASYTYSRTLITWGNFIGIQYTTPPYISFHIKDIGWSCVLNCFMLSSLPCFCAFCWSVIPTSCYIFNVFYSCSCHFFLAADACLSWSFPSITEQQVFPHRFPMLELKFAIYYRAASLPSQASQAVLAQESLTRPGFLQTLPAHRQYF